MALLQQSGDAHRSGVPVRRAGCRPARPTASTRKACCSRPNSSRARARWDVLLGAAFTQRYGAWSFDANVLGIFAGRGAQDTKLGDRFHYNAAVSYRLVGYAPRGLELQASLPASRDAARAGAAPPRPSTRRRSPGRAAMDRRRGARAQRRVARQAKTPANVFDLNSGGHVLLLSPGLRVSYGAFLGFRVVRRADRQPDERAAVEDRISCLDRHFLCLLTVPITAAAVVRSVPETFRPGSADPGRHSRSKCSSKDINHDTFGIREPGHSHVAVALVATCRHRA